MRLRFLSFRVAYFAWLRTWLTFVPLLCRCCAPRSLQVVVTHRSYGEQNSGITDNTNGRVMGSGDTDYDNDVMVWVK